MKHFFKFTSAVFLVAAVLCGNASAQITDVTFSRPATFESGVSEINFRFNVLDDVEVEIDQLGAVAALFQNNDAFGTDFGVIIAGPVTSIGEVTIGQVLAPGTDFGSTSLLVSDFIAPGEDFFLGFSNGTDVGYFNIAWEPGTNGDIVYSSGEFASGGFSLSVVTAVPEPGSFTLVSAMALMAFIRRKRKS